MPGKPEHPQTVVYQYVYVHDTHTSAMHRIRSQTDPMPVTYDRLMIDRPVGHPDLFCPDPGTMGRTGRFKSESLLKHIYNI